MKERSQKPWTVEFEQVCHQHTGRGHGPRDFRDGPGGPLGPPPWLAQMFGPKWGRPGGSPRAQARRGDVRTAILDVLSSSSEPLNGYQIIQQVAERTNGAWKPSPGSVYPTIASLQDEGLVEDSPLGRKSLQLTAEGRAHVAANAASIAEMWKTFDQVSGSDDSLDLRQVIAQTVGAIIQVATHGTADQRDKAVEILAETRRRLYELLADGPAAPGDADDDANTGSGTDSPGSEQ
ncbi:MAG: PadR family transcriptional regulator [Candidatus Nanopelagicales bacterium]